MYIFEVQINFENLNFDTRVRNLFLMFGYFFLFVFVDPPDIVVEKSWVHTGEGYETQLVCLVHADPQPTVSVLRIVFF